MTSVTVTLPYPPAGLSPNSRLGWRAKAKLTREYREACGWAAKERLESYPWRALTPPVEAHVTFYVPDRRRRDSQNLLQMLKSAFDGFIDAGLLQDDSHEVFSVASVSVEVGEPGPLGTKRRGWKREPRVVVVLKGGSPE